MAQVKDLKAKQGNVEIELDILDVGQAREFQKFGKPGRVATAIGKDESGDVKITLWNDEIEKIKAGDKIKIANGYVSEWQGELQVSTGRFGTIEIVGSGESNPSASSKSSKPSSTHLQSPSSKKDDDLDDSLIDDEEDVI